MSDYLWDKTGEPEEDVEQLENLLGALKYQPRPLEIPASAMPKVATRPAWMIFSRPHLAIAASLLLMLLAGIWFVTRQDDTQKDQLAKAARKSAQNENKPIETVVVPDAMTSKEKPIDNTVLEQQVSDKNQEYEAPVVAVSAPKVHRTPRRLMAKRHKQQPRQSVEDAPVPREFIATNGGMRWEVEQPLTPEQREATEKLMLALQVASAKFNYAQREMREIGRATK